MIVVDTSAWVELLRKTGSRVHLGLRRRIEERAELAVTEVVVAELLAGARSDQERGELRSMLLGFPLLSLWGLDAYEAAVDLFRSCRVAGDPIRHLTDCLVAVPAIHAGATLLAVDRDFETLARHSPLRLEPLDV
ncbi:MAG: PIN domain nuclease [Gaiellaceae bacterium]